MDYSIELEIITSGKKSKTDQKEFAEKARKYAEVRAGLPKNFSLTNEGVIYNGNEEIFICSPLRVVADTCDAENNGEGFWNLRTNEISSIAFPFRCLC